MFLALFRIHLYRLITGDIFLKRLIALLTLVLIPVISKAGPIQWEPTYKQASAESQKTHHLMMVDFWATWCGWCKQLDAQTYPNPEVQAEARNFVPLKLNADTNGAALARRYGVQGLPTVLFLDSAGHLYGSVVGFRPAPQFTDAMKQADSLYSSMPGMAEKFRQHPSDLALGAKLVALYSQEGRVSHAVQVYTDLKREDPHNRSKKITSACIEVGQAYAEASKFEIARSYFSQSLKMPGTPTERELGNLLVGTCDIVLHQKKAAVPYLKVASTIPGIPAVLHQRAAMLLKSINK